MSEVYEPRDLRLMVLDLGRRVKVLEARSGAEVQAATSAPAAPEKPTTGRTFDDAIAWLRARADLARARNMLICAAVLDEAAEDLQDGMEP